MYGKGMKCFDWSGQGHVAIPGVENGINWIKKRGRTFTVESSWRKGSGTARAVECSLWCALMFAVLILYFTVHSATL